MAHLVPQRVLIDASHTYRYGLRSGVQRVVRRICREALRGVGPEGPPCVPVMFDAGTFLPVVMDVARGEFAAPPPELRANILQHVPPWYVPAAERLCRWVPHARVRRNLLPPAGHLGVFRWPVKCIEWHRRRRRLAAIEPVRPGPGDLLLLPDAYWAYPAIWPGVKRARRRGARVAVVIYDLLPITLAHMYGERNRRHFERYLMQTVQHADVLAAISDTVRDQLLAALPPLLPRGGRSPEVISFPLGAEFEDVQGDVRPQIRDLFDTSHGSTPYLMVSSFDPRKNHHYALDAFESLWKTHPEAQLCLVGTTFGSAHAFLERAAAHPQLNRRLFLFHDLSDAEVQFCYERSRAVLMPSVAEGFGLPIVEALWNGRKVFASDIAIHREVGQNDCEYFDLSDCQTLVELLCRWERRVGSQFPPRQPSRVCVPWDYSARELFRRTFESLQGARAAAA